MTWLPTLVGFGLCAHLRVYVWSSSAGSGGGSGGGGGSGSGRCLLDLYI